MPLSSTVAEAQAAQLRSAREAGEELADFHLATSAMEIGTWKGAPVVNMIGSSTVRDMHGDMVLESALTDMASKAGPGLVLWLNHDYTLPDSVFGSLIKSPNITVADGIADLHITSDVEMENKKATDTYKMIQKGRRFGCSVGMRVDAAEIDEAYYEETGLLALQISKVTPVEWSVVGVPANQRSWVENALLGVYTKSLRRNQTALTLRLAPLVKSLFPRDYRDICHAVAATHPDMANTLAGVTAQRPPAARRIYWDPITRDFGELTKKAASEDGTPASDPEFVALSRDQVVQRLAMQAAALQQVQKGMHQPAGGAGDNGSGGDDLRDPEADARVAAAGADPFDNALVLVDASHPLRTPQVLVSAPADVIAGEEHPEGERNTVLPFPPGWTALAETTARAAPPGHVILNGWTFPATPPAPAPAPAPAPVSTAVLPPSPTTMEPPVTKDTTTPLSPYRAWKQAGLAALTAATNTTKDAASVALADDGLTHDPCFGFHTHHGYTHYHVNDAVHTDATRAPESDLDHRARKDAARAARLVQKTAVKQERANTRNALLARLLPPAAGEQAPDPAAPLAPLDPKIERKAAMLKDLADELGLKIKADKPLVLPRAETLGDKRWAAVKVALKEAAAAIRIRKKSGASISQDNLARLQLAHDALNLVTDGSLCQKTVEGSGTAAPIQVLSGITGVTPDALAQQLTNYETLAKGLEGFATTLAGLDLGALKQEVTTKQAEILASLNQARADLVTLKSNIDLVRNMPLGRPTGANSTVHVPGSTATWMDLATSGVNAPTATPPSTSPAGRPANAVSDGKYPGTYLHVVKRGLADNRSFEQRCRHWPSSVSERPELSASQMMSMTTAQIYDYTHGQEVDVPERD